MIKRPMLSGKLEEHQLDKINYPVLSSPKIDGIRCLKLGGKVLTRSFKPVVNNYIREQIKKHVPNNIDGEIYIDNCSFSELSGQVRKESGEPDFVFMAFDYVNTKLPFEERYKKLKEIIKETKYERLKLVQHKFVYNKEELLSEENLVLQLGFEGIMVRSIDGLYKEGRSTFKQGWLLKLKRFLDSEAKILGFVERMHNENPKEENELGLSKRSTHKENKTGLDTLGAFEVEDLKSGVKFNIATGEGLTDELRKEIWRNKDKYKTEIVKYKYQGIGMDTKPRIPIWMGFRAPEDM